MKTYKQGEKIKDINELFEQNLVWWQGKVRNIEVIKCWQYQFIEKQMPNFYKAERDWFGVDGKIAKERANIERLAELLKTDILQIECEFLFSPNCTDEFKMASWLYHNGYRYLKQADKTKGQPISDGGEFAKYKQQWEKEHKGE